MKTFYWSAIPGKFIDTHTGEEFLWATGAIKPSFSLKDWYENLTHLFKEVFSDLHSDVHHHGPFIVVSIDVAVMLEMSYSYFPVDIKANSINRNRFFDVPTLFGYVDILIDPDQQKDEIECWVYNKMSKIKIKDINYKHV